MIKLINGNVQNANGQPLNGSLTLQLAQDSTLIASPGTVVSAVPITFQFLNGNLVGTCQIYSSAELNGNPSYLVTFKDQNNSRISQSVIWQFTQLAGSTVDIGTMVNLASPPGLSFASPVVYDVAQGGSLQLAYNAKAALGGGTVNVPPNYTETLTANLVMNANNTGFVFWGPAQINLGSNQVVIPDTAASGGSLQGAYIIGPSMWGSSATGNFTTQFIYTGTGAAIVIGTSGGASANAQKITLKNFGVNISGAGSSAIGIDTYGLGFFDFDKIIPFGDANAAHSQIGLRMNPNVFTDGEAGEMRNCDIANTNIGIQLNNTTYKTFTEVNIQNSSGGVGWDLQGAGAIRILGGGVAASPNSIAYRFGGLAAGNYIVSGAEAGSGGFMATFGASCFCNELVYTNNGNIQPWTNAGATSNIVRHSGNQSLLNEQGPTGILTGNNTDQTVYTYTLPADTLGPGKGLRITSFFNHTSGGASVTWKLSFGSGLLFSSASTLSGTFFVQIPIFNNAGVTNAQHTSQLHNVNNTVSVGGNGTTNTFSPVNTSVDTTQPQVIKLTFNVANTDQVTGGQFLVELIQ